MVYWNSIDIVCAVIGGFIIAMATSMNMYFYGRMLGMSKMFNNLIKCDHRFDFVWKYSFLFGFLTIPFLFYAIEGNTL